ncbi:MAG: hypothetical protein KDA21_04085, partial [Phycisphaerales bacterium]|nr:hypothetical protein [Phycisphaerales bacterium]
NNLIDLDVPVTVDSVAGQYDIHLNGGTLTVLGEMSSTFGYLRGGNIAAGSMRASSTMLLDSVQGTVGPLTLDVNADLRLQGGTNVTMGDITFAGDGDLYSTSGALPTLNLAGRTIRKSGGTSVSEVQVLILGSDLTVNNASPFSLIRFGQYEQEFSQLNLALIGSSIEFSKDLTLGNVTISNAGVAPSLVTFRGDVTLTGTLTHHFTPGASPQDVAVLTKSFGTGRLSGGTLACTGSARFTVKDGATLCEDNPVINTGNLVFLNGVIRNFDLPNSGVFAVPAGGMCLVEDATLDNTGQVKSTGTFRLGSNGRLLNHAPGRGGPTTGLWDLTGTILPVNTTLAPTTRFRNESILIVDNSSAIIGVPCESTADADINLYEAALKLAGSADLRGRVHAFNSTLTVDPDPWAQLLPHHIDVVLSADSESLLSIEALLIKRGDIQVTRIANDLNTSIPVTARMTGSTILRGGTIAMAAPSRFDQDGGTVGAGSATTNTGEYRIYSGELGAFQNAGNLFISLPSATATLPVDTLNNTFAVVQEQGEVTLTDGDITNAGLWIVPGGGYSGAVRHPVGIGLGSFINTGDVEANSQSTFECRVRFDNQGRVKADGGEVRFTATVVQYDEENERLTGGIWEAVNDGTITLPNQVSGRVREIVAPAAVQFFNSTPEPEEPWSALDRVGGDLGVSGGSTLDLTSNDSGGDLEISPGGAFTAGELLLRGTTPTPSRLQAQRITCRGTMTLLDGALVEASADLLLTDDGLLQGDGGMIDTPLVRNLSGRLTPGVPPTETPDPGRGGPLTPASYGVLELSGDYEQMMHGELVMEIGGELIGQYDRVVVHGAATLGGRLRLVVPRSLEVPVGTTWPVLEAASITGRFAVVEVPPGYAIVSRGPRLLVRCTGPCPADLNGDASIDIQDLALFVTSYGTIGADLDGDGDTDTEDLTQLLKHIGTNCGG